MDAFYASIEVAKKPKLRGKPVIVGGRERSVVLAATYEARALGIKSAMPISRAKVLAPQAIFLDPDHQLYGHISNGVMEILRSVTPALEQVSVDEAFLDVSGARRRLGSSLDIGRTIRAEIEAQFSITASVGVAENKFVAKLASTHAKPDGILLIPQASTIEFVQCMPVGALWGVGAKTQEKLRQWGIEEVHQLAALDLSALSRMVGKAAAQHLHELAWGRDGRTVETHRKEKSVGVESTFVHDEHDLDTLLSKLLVLSDECSTRLRRKSMQGRTVALKVRDADFNTVTRSVTLASSTHSSLTIYHAVRELFLALPRQQSVRLLGVRVENIVSSSHQPQQDTLEESITGFALSQDKSDRVMDDIRAKFGRKAIERATQTQARLSSHTDNIYPLSKTTPSRTRG